MAGGEGLLTPEDLRRSSDRQRVVDARRGGRHWQLLAMLLGPGILVMLGENDGPSMLAYAAAGATYGIGFFIPFILVTFGTAIVVQEMSVRVGAVTHRGYGQLIFQRFGKAWGWLSAGDLVVTNLVTLITELIAIRVGMGFFGISPVISVIAGVALVGISMAGGRYRRWERVALVLASFNLLFVAAALLSHPDTKAVVTSLVLWRPLPGGSLEVFLLLIASTIGATVTPWMVFFQQSAVADKGVTPRDLGQSRADTVIGGVLAAFAGIGALVVAAVLFSHHVDASQFQGGAGFAQALRPYIGQWGAAIFSLGLVEAGALAMVTISASTAYAMGEALGRPASFNRKVGEAPWFYATNLGIAVVAAGVVLIPGAPLLSISLNANILAVVLMPVVLVFMLMLANDRELMGPRVNPAWLNLLGGGIAVLIALSGTSYALIAAYNALTGRTGG
ncbi:MAG TPA: divalent metal cation transporter [Candidatus Dormibacteraeota bacterium]|nr:divalent metal cation transporter [Candidatus Dormibacteraeota bacterium]